MGCCLSKKDPSSSPPLSSLPTQQTKPSNESKKSNNLTTQLENKKKVAAVIETEKHEDKKQGVAVVEEEKPVKKKEVFIIQHRKSNDRRPESKGASDSDGSVPCNAANLSDPPNESGHKAINGGNGSNILANAAVVRTSSCTKEEVDAILIQCGRLSRSSSGKVNGPSENRSGGRKYSGSKRSHDFDVELAGSEDAKRKGSDLGVELNSEEIDDYERQRRRQSRGSHRRRTPSRSRERDQQQQQRSGSQERGTSSGSGRRVSRSPGRRSESPLVSSGGNASSNSSGNGRPGKMVSVPATVSSLSMDKSNNGGGGDGGSVKRVLVKRNVGDGGAAGSRGAASPRSQSPARANASGNGNGGKVGVTSPRSQSPARGNLVNGNGGKVAANENNNNNQQQQQPSLSRNSSRKAEHSPYRRTPLSEIDVNSLPFQPLPNKPAKAQQKAKEIEEDVTMVKQSLNVISQNKCVDTSSVKVAAHGTHKRTSSRGGEGNETANMNHCSVNEHQAEIVGQLTENKRDQLNASEYDAILTPVIVSGAESVRLPQTLMRSRSSRRSRDLDINVDALLNPNASSNYNSLLLQDIQNFHQNGNANTNATATTNTSTSTPFTLPPCVTKACSIVEAVADLNSSTGSSVSCGFANDRQKGPLADLSNAKAGKFSFTANPVGKRRLEAKDPFVESEINGGDDLMAPSLHRYVTVRKKDIDEEEQESSGSNSFVGSQQNNWVSSSSWEPNSADSNDCWQSRSITRGEDRRSPVAFERFTVSEPVCRIDAETHINLSENRRESSSKHQQSGDVHARADAGRGGVRSVSPMAAAAST
ncbi:hypothetical protein Ancab_023888 [Ancistrocladus abbreviatus]